ncbi:MAG: hypothetical protein AB7O64_15330 [Methylibium sp.]
MANVPTVHPGFMATAQGLYAHGEGSPIATWGPAATKRDKQLLEAAPVVLETLKALAAACNNGCTKNHQARAFAQLLIAKLEGT